jgi:cytoskeletal protein RodZ
MRQEKVRAKHRAWLLGSSMALAVALGVARPRTVSAWWGWGDTQQSDSGDAAQGSDDSVSPSYQQSWDEQQQEEEEREQQEQEEQQQQPDTSNEGCSWGWGSMGTCVH